MTEQEAIDGLKKLFSEHELDLPCTDSLEILHMAIDSLEKQIKQSPISKTENFYYKNCAIVKCPTCNGRLKMKSKGKYCDKCGQNSIGMRKW